MLTDVRASKPVPKISTEGRHECGSGHDSGWASFRHWFARKYFYFGDPLGASYAVFGVPAILGLVLLSNATFLGIASRELSDSALEW